MVSLIIPVYNEEKHIEKCIKSIINQSFPLNAMEIIFIDGNSNDGTMAIINKYKKLYFKNIFVITNPKRNVPTSMNLGIYNAKGKYIIRIDAHSEYPNDYIYKCIETIKSTDADNIGGLALTKGVGIIGETFAQILSSKFGVGDSKFRTKSKSGYVDTVPFGTYRKETFIKYGYFDERLIRNQDYELNYRIRKNGGKIYLNADIKLYYFCKSKIDEILKQSYENGKWNIITMKFCFGTMNYRHFIPLLFFLSLFIIPMMSIILPFMKIIFLIEIILYFTLNIFFSIKNDEPAYKNHFFVKIVLFPFFHLVYGFGSFIGLLKYIC